MPTEPATIQDPTIREASRLLGVSDSMVRKLGADGLLAIYREHGDRGGKLRVSRAGIDRYLEAGRRARAEAEKRQARALRTKHTPEEAA